MQAQKMTVQSRTILGRKVKKLRADGIIPATVYGKGISSTSIQVSNKTFMPVYNETGETGLIDLTIDNEKSVPVLVHTIQYHPVTQEMLHIDFFQVNLKEKLVTNVPLTVTGESPAVRDQIATLLTLMSEIEVEALPTDIPEEIQVDISELTEVDQTIKVKELKAPKGAEITSDPEQDVVRLAELAVEEEPPQEATPEEGASATEAGETPEAAPESEKESE